MKFFHLSAALLLLSNQVFAAEIDWYAAEDGTFFQGRAAYAGCAKLTLPADMAKKVAILRASANNARTRNIMVSGKERSETIGSSTRLKFTITESSSALLRHTTVLHEEVVDIEGDSSLCVLIAGS